ncbi:RNA-directed DNA polymerase, eukaryota [Tanacetum coccineum]
MGEHSSIPFHLRESSWNVRNLGLNYATYLKYRAYNEDIYQPQGNDDDSDGCPSEGSYHSYIGSDNEDEIMNYERETISDNKNIPTIEVNSRFSNAVVFKRALNHYALMNEFEYFIEKSEPTRFTARCAQLTCRWRIHAAILQDGVTFKCFNMVFLHSKEDQVRRISKSVFITNFPDDFGPSDLWKLCGVYGTVVDVFIPNRMSKAGKRFAFVRFIRVVDMDRLIGNLCTLWVGRFHIHANAVRYERPSKSNVFKKHPNPKGFSKEGTFVSVVKEPPPQFSQDDISSQSPALVLDDACGIERDLSRHVMGMVKDLSSILIIPTHISSGRVFGGECVLPWWTVGFA